MLSYAERLILYNQYEILKKLDPKQAAVHEENQEIVYAGYEILYPDLGLSETSVTVEVSQEVHEILNMFRALKFSADRHGYVLDGYGAQFDGFDGNHDDHYGYAQFLRRKQKKWKELEKRPDNSHGNVLGRYRNMLDRWQKHGKEHDLTVDQIKDITTRS
ncbi:hypothetical protein EV217_2873 [Phyllobacterium myrsinacearum]|uniref:YfbU family protein n=1 Tax=Phyllobacterium myrsinacearum TaxID=28101 RepID=UPI00102904C9|nr:YfbU family protein [Phyllobacterium myrsinacearum]RZS82060.1 hypothetical protein EV217_2873 [Phyllobacterium myrsinacearum]